MCLSVCLSLPLSPTHRTVSRWATPVPLCLLSVCESELRAVVRSWVGAAVKAAEGGEKGRRSTSSEKLGKKMHGGGQTLGFSQMLRWRSVFKTWKASSLSSIYTPPILFSLLSAGAVCRSYRCVVYVQRSHGRQPARAACAFVV